MGKDPWTDPDPQPGDFDAELDGARSDQIEIREGNLDAKLSILVSVEGDDAKRLEAERPADEWGDLEQFSARASRGVLRHMTEDEEKAGLSWEEFRPQ